MAWRVILLLSLLASSVRTEASSLKLLSGCVRLMHSVYARARERLQRPEVWEANLQREIALQEKHLQEQARFNAQVAAVGSKPVQRRFWQELRLVPLRDRSSPEKLGFRLARTLDEGGTNRSDLVSPIYHLSYQYDPEQHQLFVRQDDLKRLPQGSGTKILAALQKGLHADRVTELKVPADASLARTGYENVHQAPVAPHLGPTPMQEQESLRFEALANRRPVAVTPAEFPSPSTPENRWMVFGRPVDAAYLAKDIERATELDSLNSILTHDPDRDARLSAGTFSLLLLTNPAKASPSSDAPSPAHAVRVETVWFLPGAPVADPSRFNHPYRPASNYGECWYCIDNGARETFPLRPNPVELFPGQTVLIHLPNQREVELRIPQRTK